MAKGDLLSFVTRLGGQALPVLAIFVFRCVPFVAYACCSARVTARHKLIALLLFGALVAICAQDSATLELLLVRTPLALAYFAALGLLVHRLGPALGARRITKPGLLLLLVLLFVVLPALLDTSPAALATNALGWEIMLSSYSYCLDTARSSQVPSRNECLFFLIVNPTLVYNERGQCVSAPCWHQQGLLRAAFGIVTMLGRDALNLAFGLGSGLQPISLRAATGLHAYLGSGLRYTVHGLGLYFSHSGLASVQIGLMRLTGYQIPERYRFPLFATNPEDFWRRWNIWLGSWAKRYLYFPLALQLARKWRSRAQLGKLAALVTTFLVVGLLHDLVAYTSQLSGAAGSTFVLASTLLFSLFACGFVVWLGLVRLTWLKRLSALFSYLHLRPLGLLLGWLLFGQFMLTVTSLTLPSSLRVDLPHGPDDWPDDLLHWLH